MAEDVKKTHDKEVQGKFDVNLNPLDVHMPASESLKPGRMTIDKIFHGPLSATSKGEMLSVMTAVPGSAGYVAMEIVSGTLDGKTGTFALQHFGVMDNGKDSLILKVVPDSGTDELAGLSGDMKIIREGGEHSYVFNYAL